MAQEIRQADIAKKLGVSVVAVSRALSGKEGVGQVLREQILETAAAMGYTLKPGRDTQVYTSTVGILIAEEYLSVENSFFSAMQLHLNHALTNHGAASLLKIIPPDSIPGEHLIPKSADGLVVVGKLPPPYLTLLETLDLPLLYLDFYAPDSRAVSVLADGYLGAWELTRYLLSVGHRKIGYLGSIDSDANAQDRYFGYCKALAETGLTPRPDWIIPNRAKRGFFETYHLPEDLPTAFVCDCDQSASLFTRDLIRQGHQVPKDISITGFYNHVFSTLTSPALTTYSINMAEMGRRAATAIIDLIRGEPVSRRILISGEPVLRESVTKPPSSDP